jgi:formate dehydrogenase iron-sulfur subunit
VINRREDDGHAWKCTLCYDRIGAGMEPTCAKACPTDSIQFGPVDELQERAAGRLAELHQTGTAEAGCTAQTPATASAAPARSSCCWMSRRSTACRPIRS